MIKHSNGLYEDKGIHPDGRKHHHYFYKTINSSVYRYSKTLDKWILCLDESVNKQIEQLEKLSGNKSNS